MDKPETWITWLLMAYVIFKVTEAPATAGSCVTAQSTGWGVTDLLANNNAQGGTLAGFNGGCACDQ